MVRHSTFQVFSDLNAKAIDGYKEPVSSGTQGNDARKVHKPDMSLVDKVENVTGSCAGAGSSEFHLYINARKREMERMENIEAEKKAQEEARLAAEKSARFKKEAEDRTRKNAEKRKRKKDNQKKNKKLAKLNGVRPNTSGGESNDEDSDEDNGKEEEATEAVPDKVAPSSNEGK